MKESPFVTLVLSLVFAIAVGWILVLGRDIFIPVVIAVILLYLILSATRALRRMPLLKAVPETMLRLFVLAALAVLIFILASIIASTLREIGAVFPSYQSTIETMITDIAAQFDAQTQGYVQDAYNQTIAQIDVRGIIFAVLGGFTSFGTTLFVIVVYTAFLLVERKWFAAKVAVAMQDSESSDRILAVVDVINKRISDYLAVKSLINVVIGVISYVILRGFSVDFALFWAIVIGVLNYIPYVGSLIAVMLPVVLSIAQFGSVATTLSLLTLLTTAQILVGNVLEPKVIGEQLNLSPFVVLLSLAVWSTLWGIPGAILAVPLTSILTIMLSAFEKTRFLAILLSNHRGPDPQHRLP